MKLSTLEYIRTLLLMDATDKKVKADSAWERYKEAEIDGDPNKDELLKEWDSAQGESKLAMTAWEDFCHQDW